MKDEIIKFEKLNKYTSIEHGFSTRLGGVSEGIYSSMNLGLTRGDSIDNVLNNFRIISKKLNMPFEHLVLSAQTHTTNIRIVGKEDWGKGITREKDYEDIDGLMTNVTETPLVTFYADCIPLIFFDPQKNVIASSHSGWRGTVSRMGKVTVEAMTHNYGCNPKDIIVCIGPGICKNCYEVSADVADAFRQEFSNHFEKIVFPKENDKYLIDLKKANEYILMEAGILKENIDNASPCTCCNSDWLFSHRASNGKRGNLAAFIMLKDLDGGSQ